VVVGDRRDSIKGSSMGSMLKGFDSFCFSSSSVPVTMGGSGAVLSGEGTGGTSVSVYKGPNDVGVLNGRCLRGAACLVGDMRPA
jgi:hypothetical protein